MPQVTGNITTDRDTELIRLKYAHVQTLCCLVIIGVIAGGGIVCMARGNDKGLTVLTAIISLLSGYFLGIKRTSHRSANSDD
jgi:hypothetical protein